VPIERGCGSIPARGVGVPGRKLLTARRRLVVSRDFVSWNQIAGWLKQVDGFRACS
jgi:hypothetical protein